MTHPEIIHDEIPVRLFKSDFLEFFTHISPITVIVIWLPIAIYFTWTAISNLQGQSGWFIPVGILIGLFLWTISEYLLHRFLFHFKPRTPRQERLSFLFHGVHHAQPQEKSRLVMPIALSIPLAALFYFAFVLIIGRLLASPDWVGPLFTGFLVGYLIYDLTHYATHHFPMRSGYAKYIKRYHMQHHYKTPNARFGVSSPVWDYVFNTMPG
jgi:sterol desaturase/sphingolipid hydroxylase (fatty acid hydroxylase superfamily)